MNAEAGDYVTVVYAPEKKLYVREVVKNDEHDFRVSFLQHTGVLFESSIFREQKEADFVLVARKNTLFLTPQSMAMKKSLLILEGNTLANIVRLLGKWSK